MGKIPIVINVDRGIVESVDSPAELDILIMDNDPGAIEPLWTKRLYDTEPDSYNWPERIKEIKEELKAGGLDPEEHDDMLKAQPRPTIDGLEFKFIYDDMADASHLGEFSDDANDDDLKRHSAFIWNKSGRNTFNYFIPAMSVLEHRSELSKLGYSHQIAEEKARLYCRQDLKRMKGLNLGDWHYIGIQAAATVKYPVDYGIRCSRLENFTSAGLWGIETDASEDYIKEVQKEELAALKTHLEEFRVDLSDWEEHAPEATGQIEDIEYS